jgi:hypothetical protein
MPDIRDDNTLDEESFFAKDDGAPVPDGVVVVPEGATIADVIDQLPDAEPEPEPEPEPAPKRRARKPKAKTSARKEKK